MLKSTPEFVDNPTLWRYIDLAKLIDMLESNQLFLIDWINLKILTKA